MNEPTKDLGKVSVTVSKDEHDSSIAYERLTIVREKETEELAITGSYISIKDVPSGTELSNTTYWCALTPSMTVEDLRTKLRIE